MRSVVLLVFLFYQCFSALAEVQRTEVRMPMRDGVELAANVFTSPGARSRPVLLVRTPYNKGVQLLPNYEVFLDRGFTVVVQDVRGRFASKGVFRPAEQEINDGDDTLNWIAAQPWCDGNIGMLGGSYLGIAQWKAALTRNKHLKAIFPVVAGGDEYLDRFYSTGGALKLGHRLLWIHGNLRNPGHTTTFQRYVAHLPVRSGDQAASGKRIDFWQETVSHPEFDSYWKTRSTLRQIDRIDVPAFIVGGWYDNFVQSDLEMYTALSKKSAVHRLMIGPWPHNMSDPFPNVDFGPDANAPIRRIQLQWFKHWLTPGPVSNFERPPVEIFVMGANKWRAEKEWPLQRAKPTLLYLSSTRGAASLQGDGVLTTATPEREGRDLFAYDPRNPVPTRGGAVCCDPKVFPWGPMDQRPVESRKDVLVYTTPPLKEDIEVTGNVRAVLYISSSAPDTDFTAKLVDVFPDGEARNICDGILRLRYRDSIEKAKLSKPGTLQRITVDAGVTSNVFKAGHRIRLEISSSNFPRFDRNMNTGRLNAEEREPRIANQTVFHGGQRASALILPVIED